MRDFARFLVSTTAGTAALALMAPAAHAQDNDAPTDAADGTSPVDGAGISEILVSAQRRTEPLSKAPISVSAFQAERLASADINNLSGIADYTPSMTFNQSSGASQIYLRGVGSNIASSSTDGSVALNVDGVYIARPAGALVDSFDVERVEVLRGPQGTLYGRNATAGAINIYSKRPTDQLEGYANLIYGSFNRREVQAAISGPITDSVRARIAGRFKRDDGFTKNLDARGPNHLDNDNIDAVRFTLDAAPTDSLKIELTADYTMTRSDGRTVRPLDGTDYATELGMGVPTDFHSARNNLDTFDNNESWGLVSNISYDFGPVSLYSVTGYRELNQYFFLNTDGTEADVSESIFRTLASQFSQEIRLQSNGDGPLSWIIGGYYFNEDVEAYISLPRLGGAGTRAFPYSTVFAPTSNVNAYAGFADATYRLSDLFAFSAGIRYSREDKDLYRQMWSPSLIVRDLVDLDQYNLGTPTLTRSDKVSYEAWTPRFVLNYTPANDVLIYASVSKGFKAGGANQAAVTSDPFDNENIWSYELGTKITFADRKAFIAASVFRYDYTDLQVTTYQNGTNAIQNAGSAKPWGGEVELRYAPSRSLKFDLSGAYLHATYDQFESSLGGVPTSASGNRMIGAPEFTGSAAVTYTVPLNAMGALDLFASVNYRSTANFNQFNFAETEQPGYALVNARITWTSEDGSFSISGFGKNLFDQDYLVNIATFTSITAPDILAVTPQGTALGYPGPGRQLGIEVGVKF